MEKPVVSVVMPVYNGGAYIRQAIESVLRQNVPLELIIIDDCSTDETAAVVQSVQKVFADGQKGDKEIVYLKNEVNSGAAASRNRGVAAARGEYTAFLDADDWWHEDKLQRQIALMRKEGDVLCSTARALYTADGRPTGRIIHVKPKLVYKDLLYHNSINCSSVLVRTEVVKAFPMCYDDSHEDYITWLKILKVYKTACAIDEPLLNYRLSAASKSGNKLKSAKMTFKVYRYMGFGPVKSVFLFISYAVHGILKYTLKG